MAHSMIVSESLMANSFIALSKKLNIWKGYNFSTSNVSPTIKVICIKNNLESHFTFSSVVCECNERHSSSVNVLQRFYRKKSFFMLMNLQSYSYDVFFCCLTRQQKLGHAIDTIGKNNCTLYKETFDAAENPSNILLASS